MDDAELVRRALTCPYGTKQTDALIVELAYRIEALIAERDDAPTFTAADLEREVSIQEAAKVILTALERAQIDMEILRMFFNGQPRSALEALSGLPADLAQRVKE